MIHHEHTSYTFPVEKGRMSKENPENCESRKQKSKNKLLYPPRTWEFFLPIISLFSSIKQILYCFIDKILELGRSLTDLNTMADYRVE